MRMCDMYTRCETKYSAVSEVGKGERLHHQSSPYLSLIRACKAMFNEPVLLTCVS